MGDKRQNNQLRLAFAQQRRIEAPMAPGRGSEKFTAKCILESPATGWTRVFVSGS